MHASGRRVSVLRNMEKYNFTPRRISHEPPRLQAPTIIFAPSLPHSQKQNRKWSNLTTLFRWKMFMASCHMPLIGIIFNHNTQHYKFHFWRFIRNYYVRECILLYYLKMYNMIHTSDLSLHRRSPPASPSWASTLWRAMESKKQREKYGIVRVVMFYLFILISAFAIRDSGLSEHFDRQQNNGEKRQHIAKNKKNKTATTTKSDNKN